MQRSFSSRGAPRPLRNSEDPAPNSTDKVGPDACGSGRLGAYSWMMRSGWRLFAALLVFRVSSAVLNQTAFVPDEYWQSLEVAHRMVFGYGYRTWEWQEGIRGYTHPLLYASLYKTLALFHIDYVSLLVELPKVLNSVLSVVCDVYVLKLAGLLYGTAAGGLACIFLQCTTLTTVKLICNVSSWFLFYCLPRSLSNSLETVLTAPLLFHWCMAVQNSHTRSSKKHAIIYLTLSAIAVLLRPTVVIMSAPLVVAHLYWSPRHWKTLLQSCITIGVLALLWSLAVDWYFYQKPLCVQWNFFAFNVMEGHSALFGTHPWHWYLTQGVPVVLGTSLLPLSLLLGTCLPSTRSVQGLMLLGGWVVLVHSLLAHKEFRFIMPVVPLSSVLAGHALHQMFSLKKYRVLGWFSCALMLANVPAAVWFCLVHQRGTLDVMTYLRSNIDENSSVLFLMPCHSTPYYSHIHRMIPMEFLECPPQLGTGYVNVAEEFYSSPEAWLDRRYPHTHRSAPPHTLPPTHLVMFNTLIQDIKSFLEHYNYQEVVRLFHTFTPLEAELGTHVVVYVRHDV